VEALDQAKRVGDKEREKRLIKDLKNRELRNKGKARGGKREPKKPKQNALEFGLFAELDLPAWSLDLSTLSDLEALAIVESIVNLDSERAQVCGVGVTCPF
jgi:hypothetical protein